LELLSSIKREGRKDNMSETVITKEQQLAQALLNADTVARMRGDQFGLCDCIDNAGNPYPSQWLANLLTHARALGLVGEGVKIVKMRWSTAGQWERRSEVQK
jgi:hypothetical protein